MPRYYGHEKNGRRHNDHCCTQDAHSMGQRAEGHDAGADGGRDHEAEEYVEDDCSKIV
jgi:hypothetical protein